MFKPTPVRTHDTTRNPLRHDGLCGQRFECPDHAAEYAHLATLEVLPSGRIMEYCAGRMIDRWEPRWRELQTAIEAAA